MKNLILTLISLFLISCAHNPSKLEKNGLPKHIYWGTDLSNKILSASQSKADFFILSNHFAPQPNRLLCGPTSGSIIMNAFQKEKNHKSLPKDHYEHKIEKIWLKKGYDMRIHTYTPSNFINSISTSKDSNNKKVKTWKEVFGMPKKDGDKKDFGLQVRQLHQIFTAHRVKSVLRVVSDSMKVEDFIIDLEQNMKNSKDFLVINYKRSALGQKGGGHISPIAAFDKNTNRVLIMDVNPNKYPWVWVDAKLLFKSMQTFDTIENRGYVLLSR